MRVAHFHYDLPEEAIAQVPVEPRHDARLLDTREMVDHTFYDLPGLLEPGDLVVVNETRVRAARLQGTRADTGGKVELLVTGTRPDGSWEALARPARRLREGLRIRLPGFDAVVIEGPRTGVVVLHLDCEDPEAAIAAAGQVPLPPYFTGDLGEPDRYQTMFARIPGSAAAPTAGLHFTPPVVSELRERGIGIAAVDLHIGLDTFRPITTDELEDHEIHSEWCSVPEATATAVSETRRLGGRVVAVGTTVVRALETMVTDDGRVRAGNTETRLFLKPGDPFRVVDLLVTNFHLPGSTLILLVAAFMGSKWREAYQTALARGYRFLSFGDAMLATREGS